jgi:predicted RNA-binding Zn ribbon-like protein
MNIAPHFRFHSGRLSLDLAGTIRRHVAAPNDMLAASGAVARWLEAAGLTDTRLLLSTTQEMEVTALREAIWVTVTTARACVALPEDAVAILNRTARDGAPIPYLDAKTRRVIVKAFNPFRAALSTLARDAIALVTGPDLDRIKACAQDDCRTLFLDASRSSRRRWCCMDRCGSRAKAVAFRERHKGMLHEQQGSV